MFPCSFPPFLFPTRLQLPTPHKDSVNDSVPAHLAPKVDPRPCSLCPSTIIWRSPCFLLPSPRDSHLRKTKCALMLFSCSRGEMAGSNTNCNNPNGCLFLFPGVRRVFLSLWIVACWGREWDNLKFGPNPAQSRFPRAHDPENEACII
nr:hypothetical protein Q903MT_gene4431 [Picea sitchensis]